MRRALVLDDRLLRRADVGLEVLLVRDPREQLELLVGRQRPVLGGEPVGRRVGLDPHDRVLGRLRVGEPVDERRPALGRVRLGRVVAVLGQRLRAPVGGREQQHLPQPVGRGDPRRRAAREVVDVDAAEVEHVERRLPVGAGDVEQAAGGLVPGADAVEVDRPAVAQDRHLGAAGRGVRDVELVAVRVAAEVGQRIEQQDLLVRSEAVAVELRRREAARPGADDDAVVALALVHDVRDLDARAAARGVAGGGVRIRLAVDLVDLLDDVVRLARQAGGGRRVVAGRERRGLRAPAVGGGERGLGAGQVRRGSGGGETGGADRHAVEEVATADPVLLALALTRHPRPPLAVFGFRAACLAAAPQGNRRGVQQSARPTCRSVRRWRGPGPRARARRSPPRGACTSGSCR